MAVNFSKAYKTSKRKVKVSVNTAALFRKFRGIICIQIFDTYSFLNILLWTLYKHFFLFFWYELNLQSLVQLSRKMLVHIIIYLNTYRHPHAKFKKTTFHKPLKKLHPLFISIFLLFALNCNISLFCIIVLHL